MLLLDINKKPTNTVLYLAAAVSGVLLKSEGLDYASLLTDLKKELNQEINPTFFGLALSFLFLIDKLYLDERGDLHVFE